jgi:hypothetical protein
MHIKIIVKKQLVKEKRGKKKKKTKGKHNSRDKD